MIKNRILVLLQDGPKKTKEIYDVMPDKSKRCIAATMSNYSETFLRLNKGLVGLRNRDEHLVVCNNFRPKLALYMKMCNCLQDGPKRLKVLYDLLSHEKRISIRATITIRPDLFLRIKRGFIGRVNRDEDLKERYNEERGEPIIRVRRITIRDKLETLLADCPMHLHDIYAALPEYPKKTITSKLSKWFRRSDKREWKIKN
jgi:hypothetical protein